ncbi:hypothetical protein VNO77_20019 [Canavalia gladiata]|uniref:Uncharacterized protein n=1 Tax=Canavalia gladiata TaxID=3824 RepID=A0AAN9LSE4_CANGL
MRDAFPLGLYHVDPYPKLVHVPGACFCMNSYGYLLIDGCVDISSPNAFISGCIASTRTWSAGSIFEPGEYVIMYLESQQTGVTNSSRWSDQGIQLRGRFLQATIMASAVQLRPRGKDREGQGAYAIGTPWRFLILQAHIHSLSLGLKYQGFFYVHPISDGDVYMGLYPSLLWCSDWSKEAPNYLPTLLVVPMHATILHVVEVGASKRDAGLLEQDARNPVPWFWFFELLTSLDTQAHTDPIVHPNWNEEASLLRPCRNHKHHTCYAYILPEIHATSIKTHARDRMRSLWEVLTCSKIGMGGSVWSGDRRVYLFSVS